MTRRTLTTGVSAGQNARMRTPARPAAIGPSGQSADRLAVRFPAGFA